MLQRDPAWAAYLIADLVPPYAQFATWFLRGDAVALLYRGFLLPVITVLGPASDAARAWNEAFADTKEAERIFAVYQPAHAKFVHASVRLDDPNPMFRMRLERTPPPGGPTLALGEGDVPALRALYQDGADRGEIPDFFEGSMVTNGVYHGVRDAGEMVAVAGTHVLTPSVAAIGNVYVKHDARGRGLGGRVTAAVVHALRARGIGTIVLNVRRDNVAAIRTYEKLGFVIHGEFFEGFAEPRA